MAAYNLALEYLRDETNLEKEIAYTEKFQNVLTRELAGAVEAIIRELAFHTHLVRDWDASWTCLENLPPELRRLIENAMS